MMNRRVADCLLQGERVMTESPFREREPVKDTWEFID